MLGHISIENISPWVDRGRYPVKRICGEPVVVEADVFRDGHQILRAAVRWRRKGDEAFEEAPMHPTENDRWRGEFIPTDNTRYLYTIEAWTDPYASWLADFTKKAAANRDIRSDLLEGISLLEKIHRNSNTRDRETLSECIKRLRALLNPFDAVATVARPDISEIATRSGERQGLTRFEPVLELVADRPKARFGSWYEAFIRSQGTDPSRPATLREAEARLPDIRDMGFDVLYMPPIHPIGVTNRKGPGNSLNGGNHAVGSPWAIGNSAGGHTAIDPALGTLKDFDHFVETANRLGLEIALDYAVQCSPDHPWVKEHPEWFSHRPDGSIKYAENPPKEYQDIYPINFDTPAQDRLIEELLGVVKFWISHGVHIFRVDNPHTKPTAFWEWLIGEIQSEHPDTIFLAEAFTRPKVMNDLAKSGFSQSYTYFTWRNAKWELTQYLEELCSPPTCDFFRPNFFTNTPDILHAILRTGGRPAFKMRLVLAATLSPTYGIYSGYELCENEAVGESEEYLDSEKYQIRVRDWNKPGNIKEFIARINMIRRQNPALHYLTNLRFLPADNDQILFYSKVSPDGGNRLLIAVNLDPFNWHECTVHVPPDVVGRAPGETYQVTDLLTGSVFTWGEHNYVRLDPAAEPAHILHVEGRP